MKILVPVKRVADPDNANKVKVAADASRVTTDGLEWKINPFDEYAVEAALRLNENAKTSEKLGETIVVYGLGLIGLLTVQLARANGCRVLGVATGDFSVQALMDCGAHMAVDKLSPIEPVLGWLLSHRGPRR